MILGMLGRTKPILLAVLSGLLLTGAFPKIGWDWLIWFALLPLLYAIKGLPPRPAFRLGFITGIIHFLTLLYWLVPVMRTYGFLPAYLSVIIMGLLAAVLAVFIALFSAALAVYGKTPVRCLLMVPIGWVALEYLRSFIFSGFPWELLGYSQFNRLQLIQISDIFGVYGLSGLIALANGSLLLCLLKFARRRWQETNISNRLALGSIIILAAAFGLTLLYGHWRLNTINKRIAASPEARIAVIQGNINQGIKWNPAFQIDTVKKYNRLSASIIEQNPELIVWPEAATPFYFLVDIKPSELVFEGIHQTEKDYLIGSPSFVRKHDADRYFNSAFLISPKTKTMGKYNKTHLVPYGEYVPLKKWLPFLGKIVAQVGDFDTGQIGNTLQWKDQHLGVQICYEIIFPALSRAMARNNASLLINITNDAWFGKTSGPYQHFSMTVLRAVENRRSLARAANTGISGFVDPAGRILASTALLEEAAVVRSLPLLKEKSIYTQTGDLFARGCMGIVILLTLIEIVRWGIKRKKT
jgi:apolipoprotein N-acyltransferase